MTIATTCARARRGAWLWRAALGMATATALALTVPTGPAAAQAASAATTGSGGGSAAGTAPVTAPRAPAKKAAPATKAPKATKATPAKPGEAAGTTPRSSKKPVAGRPADVPYDCRGLQGVSRDVCVQCADVPIYKRVVCEQKAFWSLCKGKRLFTDAYCQQNQSLGRGEGG